MNQHHLFALLSLLDLNESATAELIFANIQLRDYPLDPLSRESFNSALAELLNEGTLVHPHGRNDLFEFEYAAYSAVLELSAVTSHENLTGSGQARLETAVSLLRALLDGEAEEELSVVRTRQADEKRTLALQIEQEKAREIGYPYDILLQARETRRGKTRLYVVLLDDSARAKRGVRIGKHPDWPTLYVGLTSLTPQRRFENHKANKKAGRGYVRDFGRRLLPDLYQVYNPMPYKLAVTAEAALAEKLRLQGYTVLGGH